MPEPGIVPAPVRPVLIDPADGPCEICAERNGKRKCHRCGVQDFYNGEHSPSIHNMSGNGFRSVRPAHFHLVPVAGIAGREAVFDELCIECYRLDYVSTYQTEAPL